MRVPIVFVLVATMATLSLSQSTPSILPIANFHGTTVEFGLRIHPMWKVERQHNGLDFQCPLGTPVRAAADGKVIQVGSIENYGVVVRLQNSSSIRTFYAHLADASVAIGQTVHKGEVIGHSGNSGLSAGPHLHYEVIENGIPKNPRLFLRGFVICQ
jgi:murein DD-endopeptidase MepM/ murein hydrolase activator NlpD